MASIICRWPRCAASAGRRRPAGPATAARTVPRRRGRAPSVGLLAAGFLRVLRRRPARARSAPRRRSGSSSIGVPAGLTSGSSAGSPTARRRPRPRWTPRRRSTRPRSPRPRRRGSSSSSSSSYSSSSYSARHRVENMSCSVAGTSRIVVPVISSSPNSTPMTSSGAAIHAVSPSDSGPPMANPTKPAPCWRATGSSGAPDHRCQEPERGQGDHRGAEDEARTGLGIRLGAHQRDADRGEGDRQQHDGAADEHPDERVDPLPDGSRRVEPGAGGDHDRQGEQRQRDPVAAVSGFQIAGPADRACGAAGPLGEHQPAGAHAAADRGARGRHRRGAATRGLAPCRGRAGRPRSTP